MPLFGNPKLQDEAIGELAQMFISFPEDPTPGSDGLDGARLDFSVESLGLVDRHLDAMRQRSLDEDDMGKLILRCGAYVGEVIRRNAKHKTYHWLNYEDAAGLDPKIADFGENAGTAAILWDGGDAFCFPVGKVIKYIENGAEDSVKFFAKVMIEKGKEEDGGKPAQE